MCLIAKWSRGKIAEAHIMYQLMWAHYCMLQKGLRGLFSRKNYSKNCHLWSPQICLTGSFPFKNSPCIPKDINNEWKLPRNKNGPWLADGVGLNVRGRHWNKWEEHLWDLLSASVSMLAADGTLAQHKAAQAGGGPVLTMQASEHTSK